MKGEDKTLIEARMKTLTDVTSPMAERLYATAEGTDSTGGGETGTATDTGSAGASEQSGATGKEPPKDNVVDAEFEEVKKD